MDLVPFRGRHGRALTRFEDAMNDMFRRFFEGWEYPFVESGWSPAVDVAEREDAIVVKAELPGIKADDIEVCVHGNTLTLSGEKTESKEEKEENYYHVERRSGSFRRSIPLPSSVDADKIEANHRDGVLTITLPKSEAAKAKRIPITTK